jgi:hypothetical protein
VGPRVGLDDVEKRKFLNLSGLELRPLGRPARSQSLYRLSYPALRKSRLSNNIKSNLTEMRYESVDRIQLAQNRVHW